MVDDSNETARRAFGDPGSTPPSAATHAHAPIAPPRPRDVAEEQLADWWTRAGGFVLDQLVIAGIAAVVALVVILLMGDTSRDTVEVVGYAIAIPLGLLYAPLLMARRGIRNGQTLGKQAVGIRVVRTDGQPVTFWTGVLRNVVGQQVPVAVTFYLYALADYLWPLRDPRNQALHDKIAKTLVLHAAASERPLPGGWLPPRSPSA